MVVGGDLDGDGIVTSLVEPDEIRPDPRGPDAAPWPRRPGASGSPGRDGSPRARGSRRSSRRSPGSSPRRPRAAGWSSSCSATDRPGTRSRRRAAALGLADRVCWRGFVADRATYLDALAAADVFVFPSPAEGFPKVVLDALAVGLPVVATPSGALGELGGRPVRADPGRPGGDRPVASPGSWPTPTAHAGCGDAGFRFVAAHTRPAEAARLVARWRARWPDLPWG